jgi:hypothetical protein
MSAAVSWLCVDGVEVDTIDATLSRTGYGENCGGLKRPDVKFLGVATESYGEELSGASTALRGARRGGSAPPPTPPPANTAPDGAA